MFRVNVISGQVHGTVDWVTSDGREFGMFLRTSERDSTRCVIRGPEAEQLLANGLIHKGMMVTAYGEFAARCYKRADGAYVSEALCDALRIVAESPKEARVRGAIYANLKGVVMHWNDKTMQLKTFFNFNDPRFPKQLTCSLHMRSWLEGMSPQSQQRFNESIRNGREFTASAVVEVSCYRNSAGDQVPVLLMLPTDFRLQG